MNENSENLEELKILVDSINSALERYFKSLHSKALRRDKEELEREQENLRKAKIEQDIKDEFETAKKNGFEGDFEAWMKKKFG